MTYTRPNKTKTSTPNDVVMTNPETARWIVNHFNPSGLCLDPCAGKNAFYDCLPETKERWILSICSHQIFKLIERRRKETPEESAPQLSVSNLAARPNKGVQNSETVFSNWK